MSYTNMQVTWIPNEINAGTVVNDYGDLLQIESKPITIRARKQPHNDVIHTSTGEIITTKNIYYVDPRIEPNASKIKEMDTLDGETVRFTYIMMGPTKPVMYRFITI